MKKITEEFAFLEEIVFLCKRYFKAKVIHLIKLFFSLFLFLNFIQHTYAQQENSSPIEVDSILLKLAILNSDESLNSKEGREYLGQIFDNIRKLEDPNLKDSIINKIELKFPELDCSLALHKSKTLRTQGFFEESKKATLNVIECAKQSEDIFLLGSAYREMGIVYDNLLQSSIAIDYILKALLEFQKIDNKTGMADCYISLGIIKYNLNDFKAPIEYYHKALDVMKNEESDAIMKKRNLIYNNLGDVYKMNWNKEESLKYLLMSMEYYENHADDEIMPFTLFNIGNLYYSEGKTEIAYNYKIEGIEKAREFGMKNTELSQKIRLSLDYLKEGRATESEDVALSCLEEIEKMKDWKLQRQVYAALDQIYLAKNELALARHFYIKLQNLKDSIRVKQNQEQVQILEEQFKSKEREAKINFQSLMLNKKTLQINRALGGIFILSLIGFIVWYKSNVNHKLKSQEIELLKRQQQLIAIDHLLQGQEDERKRISRELHDGLGSLLATIKLRFTKLKVNEQDKLYNGVFGLIDNAYKEVRRIAHNMMPSSLSEMGFQFAIEDLCNSINPSNDLKVYHQFLSSAEDLSEKQSLTLFRIIQELFTNTIKHSEASNISIQFSENDVGFHITYEDDGKGFNYEKKKDSFGMQNIRSRIEYLNGQLDFVSQEGQGVIVDLLVPK